ncbi:hypothetical protein FA13DRAFT_1734121 [Coprinellus micaceus]|uniref:Uncharacterized protein n=1 Tax=Coprinellus micaceus TaxID=71717 RepID=A0A4Y7T883_COPMI|nr:hypothetical protein FA13DRAFT_1734121 [Coprinellus micaceus]
MRADFKYLFRLNLGNEGVRSSQMSSTSTPHISRKGRRVGPDQSCSPQSFTQSPLSGTSNRLGQEGRAQPLRLPR